MSVVNAGTQNQLAQMQMSAAQRAMQEEEGAQNYLADPTNDLTTAAGQRGLLRFGTKGQTILKSLAEQRKLQAEENKSKYEFEVKTLDRAIGQILSLTNLPMAFADIDRQIAAGSITPQQGAELKTRINNAPDFSTWQNQTLTGMLDAKARLDAMEEERYQAFLRKPTAAAPTAPPAVVPTAPINAKEAPLVRPTQAAVPLDKLNVSQDARGNKTYYLDGVPISEEKFAELYAASAAPVPLSGTRAAGLAAMTPAPMASAAAAAPMAPAAAAAAPMAPVSAAAAAPTPPAPAAQPDMANALALKIQGLQDQRNQLEPFLRSSSAKLKYEDLGKQIDKLSEGFSISAGGARYQPGMGMIERPAVASAPALSELTRLIAERAQAVTSGASPQVLANYDSAIKKAATFAPPISVQTNVNAYTPASEEAQKDFIRSTRATYDTLKNAPGTLKNIEETIKLIPSAKGFMGPGGESLLDAASFLNNRLGTSINTKGVTDATELRSRLFQGIIENLRKLDANPTENQQNAMRVALGNIGTDPNALPAVLNSFADTVRSKVDMHNAEVESAVSRGVKFPYDPTIKLPTFAPPAPSGAALIPTGKPAATGEWKVVK